MTRRLLSILLTLAVVLAACGDDDTDDVSGATPAGDTDSGGTGTGADDSSSGDTASTPDTITVEHYSGTDEVPVEPETVVVMDLGMLLSLDALGIAVDGFGSLGTGVPPEFSSAVDAAEPVGTAFEPDYEAINALEPDLIIVATRSSATYADMREIAPTIDLTFDEDVDFLTAFRDRHETLGQIFGVEDEVATLLADLDAAIDDIADRSADGGAALIVMTSGAEVSAYGPGSRFGVVHDVLGYAAADDGLAENETHGEAVSFEYLAETAPDVLFAIDRSAAVGDGGTSAEQILDNELVDGTPAGTSGRIVYADPFAWYLVGNSIPGLRGIITDVESSLP